MLKMEIRATTISFSKTLAKSTNCREIEITRRLQALDEFICNNLMPLTLIRSYTNLMISKLNFKQSIRRREKQQFLDPSVDGWEMVSAPPSTLVLTKGEEILIKRLYLNYGWRTKR